jgi:hypothetical protein
MFDEIPYMFYYTNKVNMVISTDGHGMYGTDTQFEDEIARTYMGDKAYKDGKYYSIGYGFNDPKYKEGDTMTRE